MQPESPASAQRLLRVRAGSLGKLDASAALRLRGDRAGFSCSPGSGLRSGWASHPGLRQPWSEPRRQKDQSGGPGLARAGEGGTEREEGAGGGEGTPEERGGNVSHPSVPQSGSLNMAAFLLFRASTLPGLHRGGEGGMVHRLREHHLCRARPRGRGGGRRWWRRTAHGEERVRAIWRALA